MALSQPEQSHYIFTVPSTTSPRQSQPVPPLTPSNEHYPKPARQLARSPSFGFGATPAPGQNLSSFQQLQQPELGFDGFDVGLGEIQSQPSFWGFESNDSSQSSPPSPSTVDTTDGGDLRPPSSVASGTTEDRYHRARSVSQPVPPSSFRRHQQPLTLSIPPPLPLLHLQNLQFASPGTNSPNGHTYPFSAPGSPGYSASPVVGTGQEYFLVENAYNNSVPNTSVNASTSRQLQSQYGYRLPASQPSSPVRSGYPPGQAPFQLPATGRPRGATVSGGAFSPYPSASYHNLTASAEYMGLPLSASHDFTSDLANDFNLHQIPVPSALQQNMENLQPSIDLCQLPVAAQQQTPTQVAHHLAYTSIANSTPPQGSVDHSPIHSNSSPVDFVMQDARQSTSQQSPMSAVYTRPPTASGLMEPQPRRMQPHSLDGANLGMVELQGQVQVDDVSLAMAQPLIMSRRSSFSQQDGHPAPDLAGDVANKLSLLDGIVSAAKGAREALLRGEDGAAHDKLGDLGNQLEIVGELGVGPAFSAMSRSGECTPSGTPAFHSPGVISSIPSSGTNSAPPTLLPSLIPQDAPRIAKRAAPQSPIEPAIPVSTKHMRVDHVNDFLSVPVTATTTPAGQPLPPPLVHSHSFPNGHQLPSQVHTTNNIGVVPSTPPSFVAATGVQQQHAPHVPSPLASHTISRPPSPPQFLASDAQLDWTGHPMQTQNVVMPMPTPLQLQIQFQQQQHQLHQQHQQQLAQHDAQFQTAQAHAQAHAQAQAIADNETHPMSRTASIVEARADGRPVVRARSTSIGIPLDMRGMTAMPQMDSSALPSAWRGFRQSSPRGDDDQEDDDSGDEAEGSDSGANGQHRSKRRRSSVCQDVGEAINPHGGQLSEEVKAQLDSIFFDFMNRVCSDLDIRDSKGEKLHQVLMPKKMQRLDESPDFRPFKFRIQAFTNAFQEDLASRGITEETMSTKKVKLYLWNQSLISRFNPDGKKAKSKGNHIWNVDAKKLPNGGWVFREFRRKIIGNPPAYAVIEHPYEWSPKIWDPQASSTSIKAEFSSPPGSLPPWLSWEGDKLMGVPGPSSAGGEFIVHAKFVDGTGTKRNIEHTYHVQVVKFPVPEGMTIESQTVQAYPQPTLLPASHMIPGRRIASEPFLSSLGNENMPVGQPHPGDFTFMAMPQDGHVQVDPRQHLGHGPTVNMAFTQGAPPSFLQQ